MLSEPILDPVLTAFSRLRVWERDGDRAPHKPLLVLLALGHWVQGCRGLIPYADIEVPLRNLLMEFGPPRQQHHPEFPFWYLRTDGVWEVTPDSGYPPRKGHSSPSARQLREAHAAGQFSMTVRVGLERTPALVQLIARTLLDSHFAPSTHEDILAAVGLDIDTPSPVRAARDRAFREAVLTAYGYACVVCRVGLRLGNAPVGVEAAHIRWHASGGPDVITNGLCMCSLHHKLFDRGALTLSPDSERVWVSEQANGRNLERALGRFHGRKAARPNRADAVPSSVFVAWHHKEVFQGRPRD
ncbi:MAG: HNH endonuclease [Planctomycetaceae bacterium]|nr:HNH endonuclease [Planctomycetaceae bacterium]